ncbi:MAG: hypothetical protein Tsb009_16560 [Planctomycetaceae bacterium]
MNARKMIYTLVVLTCAPLSALAQSPKISVKPVAVREYRFQLLVPQKRTYSIFGNALNIILRFKGDELAKATRYGKIQVTEAKDNNGKSIEFSKGSSYLKTRMSKIPRSTYNVAGEKSSPDEVEILLPLDVPPRSATSLTTVKGQMTFVISKTTDITIPASKLQDLIGKAIPDPTLKKYGLKATVSSYNSGKTGTRLQLKIEGEKRKSVLEVHFFDPAGKKVSFSSFIFPGFRSSSATVRSSKPIPEGSTIKITVETEVKEIVADFDLKDIPLK